MPITIGTPEQRSPEGVAAVLKGTSRALPLSTALALAVTEKVPDAADLVAGVLTSAENPAERGAAARILGRIRSDYAIEHLRAALETEPEGKVVGEMAVALAFVGGPADQDAILEAGARTQWPPAMRRCAFAAGVIAHRYGLEDKGVE